MQLQNMVENYIKTPTIGACQVHVNARLGGYDLCTIVLLLSTTITFEPRTNNGFAEIRCRGERKREYEVHAHVLCSVASVHVRKYSVGLWLVAGRIIIVVMSAYRGSCSSACPEGDLHKRGDARTKLLLVLLLRRYRVSDELILRRVVLPGSRL